jgi:hypothetical protein
MAGVWLTYDVILEAARRLPPGQRSNLVRDLKSVPSRAEALKVARQLRPAFRLSPKKQKRLSVLLRKGNAGELTQAQRVELDVLIEEVLDKREAMAKAVEEKLGHPKQSKNRNGPTRR